MRRPLAVILPLALVLALVLWRDRGPAAKPADAPENTFSSARAMTVLQSLLAENVPHPVMTPANAVVRDRVIARFRELGYETTVQRRFACNAGNVCATVENILAQLPGNTLRETVLVAAHYDSVPAGPGASDDGAGVAALLEIARAVRGESFRNRVVFLVDDGEEAGLLGAEAFVADPALLRDVAVVLNVEHRGTSGPSYMFETSRRNRWLIRHLAGALERPHATSLFFTIYDLLPNDTDLTVFKRADKAGVNFAAIGDVAWYHTPLDDLAHVDARTLQHQGDNMLSSLRAFANAELAQRSEDNAVYFDVLGFFMLAWPAGWTIYIAAASLLLLLLLLLTGGVRKSSPRAMTRGVIAAFTMIVLAAGVGYAMAWVSRLKDGGLAHVAAPQFSVVAMWMIGIAAAIVCASIGKEAKETLIGYGFVWHAVAIALALTLPGASYLFLVPAVVLTLCVLTRAGDLATAAIVSVAAALLFFPVAAVLYTALGSMSLPIIAALVALATMFAATPFRDLRPGVIAFAFGVAFAAISMNAPKTTPERPRPLPLAYLDDASAANPLWVANTMTPLLRNVAPFGSAPATLSPWQRYPSRYAAPAPPLGAPRVTVTREGNTIRVRSQRKANRVMLAFRTSATVTGLRINGVAPPPRPERFRQRTMDGWQLILVHGASADVELTVPDGTRIEAIASDYSYGLPRFGRALAKARNASPATTTHEGDTTITRVRATL